MEPNLFCFISIGIVAGFLAGKLMRGKGFGIIINLLISVAGALLGGWLFGPESLDIDFGSELIGSLISAFVGASILLFVIGLVKKN